MNINEIFALLQSLINAFGPCGQEDEVRQICQKELQPLVDEIWVDAAGNLIGKINGEEKSSSAIRIMVHMDEISLIVKRINEDGSLIVSPLGAICAASLGQGPLEIMGDKQYLSGILSFGSMHTTQESASVHKITPKEYKGLGNTPEWEDVYVITKKTPQELKEAGVHPGTRVVIARSRRQLHFFENCIAGYFLDNRAGIAIALSALKQIKELKQKPKRDVYFIATSSEEFGTSGASFASRTLPGNMTIAIDIGPVAKEYQTIFSPAPIIVYQDTVSTYDKKTNDYLVKLGEQLDLKPQQAVFGKYGSDASFAQQRGQAGKIALLCFPTENTHGYEIIHQDSISGCSRLLAEYLLHPES